MKIAVWENQIIRKTDPSKNGAIGILTRVTNLYQRVLGLKLFVSNIYKDMPY